MKAPYTVPRRLDFPLLSDYNVTHLFAMIVAYKPFSIIPR